MLIRTFRSLLRHSSRKKESLSHKCVFRRERLPKTTTFLPPYLPRNALSFPRSRPFTLTFARSPSSIQSSPPPPFPPFQTRHSDGNRVTNLFPLKSLALSQSYNSSYLFPPFSPSRISTTPIPLALFLALNCSSPLPSQAISQYYRPSSDRPCDSPFLISPLLDVFFFFFRSNAPFPCSLLFPSPFPPYLSTPLFFHHRSCSPPHLVSPHYTGTIPFPSPFPHT